MKTIKLIMSSTGVIHLAKASTSFFGYKTLVPKCSGGGAVKRATMIASLKTKEAA